MLSDYFADASEPQISLRQRLLSGCGPIRSRDARTHHLGLSPATKHVQNREVFRISVSSFLAHQRFTS